MLLNINQSRLIIFTRYPLPGSTKKRLIPALGPVSAAHLQKNMTVATLQMVRSASRTWGFDLEVHYAGAGKKQMRTWLGPHLKLKKQCPGDLGARMTQAFRNAHKSGCRRTVIIGTDCPDITTEHLKKAFDALRDHDLVFGPSTDGGYWLIGLRRPVNIFHHIKWGTDTVLDDNVIQAQKQNLSYYLLERLSDIDLPQDLDRLPAHLTPKPFISIIIPALNESCSITSTIQSARDKAAEIIVVDGGSSDDTIQQAKVRGVHVETSPPGRSVQMNRGAQLATGDVLLFLHADSTLPDHYASLIYRELLNPGVVAGAFRFKTDINSKTMSIIEWLVNFRARYLSLPYGDQALFVRKSMFDALGGFPRVPIAEDLYFLRSVKRKGAILIIQVPVLTSGRRYKSLGFFRTTLINQMIVCGILSGVAPNRLASLYRKEKLLW